MKKITSQNLQKNLHNGLYMYEILRLSQSDIFSWFFSFSDLPQQIPCKGLIFFSMCMLHHHINNYQLFQHWKPPFKENTLTFILFECIF